MDVYADVRSSMVSLVRIFVCFACKLSTEKKKLYGGIINSGKVKCYYSYY